MNIFEEASHKIINDATRRNFLMQCSTGIGAMALSSLVGCDRPSQALNGGIVRDLSVPMLPMAPQFPGKAKRIIFLHMAGAPSQLELFDYKPELQKLNNQDCPPSLLEGKRFAFIKGVPKMLGPQTKFAQHGQSGAYVSDLLPHFSKVVDDVTFLKAMHTDEFNHMPGQLLMLTGGPRLGRPSMGSWVTYGLGSENQNLPGFVVLLSGGKGPDAGNNAFGSGFLPSVYQGVECRSQGDPVLYVANPDGMNRDLRRKSVEIINKINQQQHEFVGDPEILSRISQYEMAFRMQMSVPEAMDISKEPDYVHQMYGTEAGKSSFANNCLLARRLVERDVRFVQLFHWGWDGHGTSADQSIDVGLHTRCNEIDRGLGALISDLKQRGLLEETLVVWGGEFGRTPMLDNRPSNPHIGRDHHSEAFTMFMAGGGIKAGLTHGETDEIGYYGIKDRTHVHDLQATILNQLGMDHEKFTYNFQGRDFRLTDVGGKVIKNIIA